MGEAKRRRALRAEGKIPSAEEDRSAREAGAYERYLQVRGRPRGRSLFMLAALAAAVGAPVRAR